MGNQNFLIGNIDISQKKFTEFSAMLSFSRSLIIRVQPGTLISVKKTKKKTIIIIMQNKCIRFCL